MLRLLLCACALLACQPLASRAQAADTAAQATVKIPSQNDFLRDFGARQPGDTLIIKVEPDANARILSGKVDNGSSQGWTGGPTTFTGAIPDTFSGVHQGKFSGTYALNGAGEGGAAAEPPKWNGAAKAQVSTLISTTLARTPSYRRRTTVGVDEQVDIQTKPSVIVDWTVEGGGTVDPPRGATTRFTAPNSPATCTVTATFADKTTQSLTYTVIKPTGAAFVGHAPFYHWVGIPSAGFTARPIYLLPRTVSFYNIDSREGDCKAVATGVFKDQNDKPHGDKPFGAVNENNQWLATDKVYTRATNGPTEGDYSGTFEWPIPWLYRKHNNRRDNGTEYAILLHKAVSDKTGETTQTKGGASKTFALNDPTVHP